MLAEIRLCLKDRVTWEAIRWGLRMARRFTMEHRSQPVGAVVVYGWPGMARMLGTLNSNTYRHVVPKASVQWVSSTSVLVTIEHEEVAGG